LAAGVPDAALHEGGAAPGSAVLNASRLLSNEELAEMRGGFFTAAGAKFDFGASVQTLVNGALALQTNLQWTPAGPVTTQQLQGLGASISAQVASDLAKAGIAAPSVPTLASNEAVADLPAASAPAASTPVADTAGTAAANVSANVPANTPIGAPVSAPAAGEAASSFVAGVQIPGVTGGSTQVFANIGPGQIQNVVLNSASGQEITQNTNVTLTIYNFSAWQQQVAQRALSAQLANDMLAASGISAGH